MCELIHDMIDKFNFIKAKFKLSNFDKLLFKLIPTSKSLSRLKFLFNIFNNNIKWEMSIKKYKCSICNKNEEKLNAETTTNLKSIMGLIKKKCNDCEKYFHLNCIIEKKLCSPKSSDRDENREFKIYDLFKSGRFTQICYECNERRRDRELETRNKKVQKMNESKKLNTIEVGSKQLRLNRARIQK
jgi:hypothetical protein